MRGRGLERDNVSRASVPMRRCLVGGAVNQSINQSTSVAVSVLRPTGEGLSTVTDRDRGKMRPDEGGYSQEPEGMVEGASGWGKSRRAAAMSQQQSRRRETLHLADQQIDLLGVSPATRPLGGRPGTRRFPARSPLLPSPHGPFVGSVPHPHQVFTSVSDNGVGPARPTVPCLMRVWSLFPGPATNARGYPRWVILVTYRPRGVSPWVLPLPVISTNSHRATVLT